MVASEFYFIQTNGDPADKLRVRGPQGTLTLSAEDAYYKALLRESNLSEGELEVLTLMKQYEGQGMATLLAEELGKKRSWVSYILKKLVKDGYADKSRRGIYHAK